MVCVHAVTTPAGGPCRELLTNWANAEAVTVAPPPPGSRCRRAVPAALRSHVEPAVLKGHGTARKRFWGAAPSEEPQSATWATGYRPDPAELFGPAWGERPTPNDSGAAERALVKRDHAMCCEWKKNPFPWKERTLTLEAIERFGVTVPSSDLAATHSHQLALGRGTQVSSI